MLEELYSSEDIKKDMQKMNEVICMILKSSNSTMQEAIDWILQERGKQLRPLLTILCSAYGKQSKDVIEYAAILEICHMATLVHDDIIDEAEYRRGQLSVQKKFGKKMAVYVGDYMIFAIFSHTRIKPSFKHKPLYDKLEKICYGEIEQNDSLYNLDTSVEQYMERISGKTAVLFELACYIGASESNAKNGISNALGEYGKNLGIIFQIRDDILDLKSTLSSLGKPVGSDFATGNYTLPIILAARNQDTKNELLQVAKMYKDNKNEEALVMLKKIIEEANAIEKSKEYIETYHKKALMELEKLPKNENTEKLKKLIDYVSTI